MTEEFAIRASRAVEPFFYRAKTPPNLPQGWAVKQYQSAGVEYHLSRNNALFGDAPGVGKTAECILLGNAIGAGYSLVICPASLRLNWEREVRMWSDIPGVRTYPVMKAKDGVSLRANYVIMSYDILRNEGVRNAILDYKWDHVILDEAHYLKDPKGNKRTQVISAPDGVMRVAGRLTMASGTILPNQPVECYNAVRMLNWDAIDRISLETFRENYYDIGGGFVTVRNPATGTWETKWSNRVRNKPKNLEDLQYRLRKHVMVRRLKEDVLHELPRKQWHPFPLAADTGIRKALSHPGWAEVEKLYELDPSAFDGGIPVDGAISTARRMLGEAKAPAVASYIEDLLDSGIEKIVVSAYHTSVLHYLRDRLAKYGLVYMDGHVGMAARQQAVDQFQTRDDVAIILGQTGPLGLGWTLTRAQDAVIAEPDWVPGQNDQLLDRIHRMGQAGSHVIGHIPVVPGTMDERVLNTAIEKDINIFAALDKH